MITMTKTRMIRGDLLYPELSYKIVGAAFDVHNTIGHGHLEKHYQKALAEAFKKFDMRYQEQLSSPLTYNGKIIGRNILDFLVEDKIIVEIKKGDHFAKTHIDQVVNYLKSRDLSLAILINFTTDGVKFKRIVNLY